MNELEYSKLVLEDLMELVDGKSHYPGLWRELTRVLNEDTSIGEISQWIEILEMMVKVCQHSN